MTMPLMSDALVLDTGEYWLQVNVNLLNAIIGSRAIHSQTYRRSSLLCEGG